MKIVIQLSSLFIYFLKSTTSSQLQIRHPSAAATTNIMHENNQENMSIL
jgi:hypothetical protein